MPIQFRKMGYEVVDWIVDYFTRLDSLPVRPQGIKPGFLKGQLSATAPEKPEGWDVILKDFNKVIM